MSRRLRLKQTLSARAAIAVCLIAALLGWAAVLGVIFAGHVVSGYIASATRGDTFNEVAPAAGPDSERRR